MASSSIEWTNATWNPVTGCNKVSPGCKHCYAERLSKRLRAMGLSKYANGFNVAIHADALEIPLSWKNPRRVFINSMSDLFHDDVPLLFIEKVFATMKKAHWHQFQILTKRSERLIKLDPLLEWASNIWMGVSVEDANYTFRIDNLRQTHSEIKFLSLEPLLGPLPNLNLKGIDWVIVGGESGPGARPMQEQWVLDIRDQCILHNIPFFFKQWGGVNKKKAGRLLQNVEWNEFPGIHKTLSSEDQG